MNEITLFFCRTPLQALIINKIIVSNSVKCHVIYRPNNDSKKHRYYFKQIVAENKTYIDHQPVSFSHGISTLIEWFLIPRKIRRTKYSNLYISSIGDSIFSFFAARNKFASINLFDDGVFNLNPEYFNDWIKHTRWTDSLLRLVMKGESSLKTRQRINHHYTIYPKHLSFLGCQVTEITDLFRNLDSATPSNLNNSKTKIRILLGSAYLPTENDSETMMEASRNVTHDSIVSSDKFDVFIPHPANKNQSYKYPDSLKEIFDKSPIDLMIAEDLVSAISNAGFKIIVYGFCSSALINITSNFQTVSFALDELMLKDAEQYLVPAGVKVLKQFRT